MGSMRRAVGRLGALVIAGAVATVLVGVTAQTAQAHETREVGDVEMVVGWANEPTFTGFTNAVQVILRDLEGEPIEDLGDALDVEVLFGDGDASIDLTLAEQFGEPGDYRAEVIPTRPGTYTFNVAGSINGQQVEESFTTSDGGFDAPQEPAEIQFPVNDPTNAQLSDLLERELERVAAEVDGSSGGGAGTVLGIVGIVIAVLALAASGLLYRRSRATA